MTNGSSNYSSINGPLPILEKKRWLIVILFAAISAMSNCIWLTFGPIADSAMAYFQVSAFEINMLSMVYLAVALVFTIPASWCLDHIGKKKKKQPFEKN